LVFLRGDFSLPVLGGVVRYVFCVCVSGFYEHMLNLATDQTCTWEQSRKQARKENPCGPGFDFS